MNTVSFFKLCPSFRLLRYGVFFFSCTQYLGFFPASELSEVFPPCLSGLSFFHYFYLPNIVTNELSKMVIFETRKNTPPKLDDFLFFFSAAAVDHQVCPLPKVSLEVRLSMIFSPQSAFFPTSPSLLMCFWRPFFYRPRDILYRVFRFALGLVPPPQVPRIHSYL